VLQVSPAIIRERGQDRKILFKRHGAKPAKQSQKKLLTNPPQSLPRPVNEKKKFLGLA